MHKGTPTSLIGRYRVISHSAGMRIGFGSLSPGHLQKGTVTHSKVVQPASGDGASPRHGAQSTTGDADSGNDRETIRVDQSNECGALLSNKGEATLRDDGVGIIESWRGSRLSATDC